MGTGVYTGEEAGLVSSLRKGERTESKISFSRGSEGTGMRVYNERDNLCPGTSAV